METPPKQHVSSQKAKRRSLWRKWLLPPLLVLLAVVAYYTAKPLYRAGKLWYARHKAAQAERLIAERDWRAAALVLADANRLGRDEPEVLRATATFLTEAGGEPRALTLILQRLIASGQARPADYLALGQARLRLGEITEARRLYDTLSPDLQKSRKGLELLSQILGQEGRASESEEILRRALSMAPDDPQARLRLALLDYSNPFSELQQRGRGLLWELARESGPAGLTAVKILAQDRNLTPPEARRLMQRVTEHPDKPDDLRLEVLSAVIRLDPLRRDEIIAAEVARHREKTLSQKAGLITWLAAQKRHDLILSLAPVDEAVQSAEVFPYFAQALGEMGRWDELRRLLAERGDLPVSGARAQVWLAQAAIQMEPDDFGTPHWHLERAFELAVQAGDQGCLSIAGQLAEDRGLHDLALRCYQRLADTTPGKEIEMTEKVREMTLRLRDTQQLMRVSRRLLELSPASDAHQSQLAYLRLLTGEEMELAAPAPASPESGGFTRNVPGPLLSALHAHRFRNREALRAALGAFAGRAEAARLSPGQRAVLSGLLAAAGRAEEAFHLAETVNASMLLPEERAFFQAVLNRQAAADHDQGQL